MNKENIYDFVINIFVELFELDKDKIHPEATLFEELELDSLDMVDLAVEMQAKFGFKIERAIDEEKLRAIRTVTDLCEMIEEKIKSGEVEV